MRLLTMVFLAAVMAAGQIGFTNHRVNKDNTTQVQNEQQIVINPTDSLNYVCDWRDFRVGYRQVGHAMTTDGGTTWSAETLFVEPTYNWDSDPGMTVDASGNFFAIILSFNSTSEPNGYFVFESSDKGRTWSAPRPVINGVPGVFEDKELIACDRTTSPYRGNLYVAWARFYAVDIMLTRSTNRGFNWSTPVRVSDGSGSFQWPVPAVGPNGEVYAAWCGAGSILFDRSTDGGTTWGADRAVQSYYSQSRNLKGGQILTFSYPAIDVDITSGPFRGYVYIVYLDNGPDGYPDMYLMSSTDQGQTWSARRRINDDPLNNRIDQFHPWVTVDRTGCISAVFYDSRMDPNNILCDVYMTQSTDGGSTWSGNIRVTTVSSDLRLKSGQVDPYDPKQPLAGQFAGWIGEYNGVAAASRRSVVPIWTDTRNGHQDTYVGVFHWATVSETPGGRAVRGLTVKPNVVGDHLCMEGRCESSGRYQLCLYDRMGRRVRESGRDGLTGEQFSWRIEGLDVLPAGIYFLVLRGPSGVSCSKVVVK